MATSLAKKHADCENNPNLVHLGQHWVANFLKRHPKLAAKYCTRLDCQHAFANHLPTLQDYFWKLERLIRKYNFWPEDMYNNDEKGFIISYSSKAKVICQAGRRPPRVTHDGIREMLTVIKCCSAGQFILPSFVIYQGSAHYMGWHSETSNPDAVFAYSKNGWTDDVLGLTWLKEFDMWTRLRAGYRLQFLILEGHRSHITLEFCKYALANQIVLMCFPANSTHLLQPLDVGLFSPLQQ
jgi:hypothetical protein